MTDSATPTRYPGYDVLSKRDTPSWDAVTRSVVDRRLSPPPAPRFFDATQWRAATALCERIIVQREGARRVPLAAMLDAQLQANSGDGYRNAKLPPLREAWRIGLAALDEESTAATGSAFADASESQQLALLRRLQQGQLTSPAWQGMPGAMFFSERVLHDICGAYYAHPFAWNEIGFGGPANPRGYVRMEADRRDPWEAAEAAPGDKNDARRINRDVR